MKMNEMARLLSRLIGFLACMTLVFSAQASGPPVENGVWWNVNQSGRGFVIEVQDKYIMISAYAYDLDGEPVFYLASGELTSSGYFTAPVLRTANGQCFNCPYRQPTATQVGTVTISFTSATSANLTFLGERISIEKFMPAEYLAYVPDGMLGEWAVIDGSTAVASYSGDRIKFTGIYYLSDGTRCVSGYRTGDTSRTALACWYASSQTILITLDSSASYYEAWRFSPGSYSGGQGQTATYLKGSSPIVWTDSIGLRINFQNGIKWASRSTGTARAEGSQSAAELDEMKRQRAATLARGASGSVTAEETQQLRAQEGHLAALRVKAPTRESLQ